MSEWLITKQSIIYQWNGYPVPDFIARPDDCKERVPCSSTKKTRACLWAPGWRGARDKARMFLEQDEDTVSNKVYGSCIPIILSFFFINFGQIFLVKVVIVRSACLLHDFVWNIKAKTNVHYGKMSSQLLVDLGVSVGIIVWVFLFVCFTYFFANICVRFSQRNVVTIKDFVKILSYALCFDSTHHLITWVDSN